MKASVLGRTRIFVAVAVASFLVPVHSAVAQEEQEASGTPEIGVLMGVTTGDGFTVVSIPGGSLGGLGSGPLYVSFPVASRVSFRLEGSALSLSVDSETASILSVGGYGSAVFNGNASGGPYLLAGASVFDLDGDGEVSVGGGGGYRLLIGPSFVMRFEARYNRFLDLDDDTFQLFAGIGATIG